VLKQETSSGDVAAFIVDREAALRDLAARGQVDNAGQPWIIPRFIPEGSACTRSLPSRAACWRN